MTAIWIWRRLSIAYRNTAPLQAEVHAAFLLRARETEIKSLKLATRNSRLEASGTFRNYNNPEVTLQYQASVDLSEVAREARLAQLRAGRAELKGVGRYQNKRYSSQGNLTVRDLDGAMTLCGSPEWTPLRLSPLTQEKIVLSRLIAQRIWRHGAGRCADHELEPAAGGEERLRRSAGRARLHLAGVQIRKVAAAISTRNMPLDKIELAGNASGDINSSWTGSPGNSDHRAEAGSVSAGSARCPGSARHGAIAGHLPRRCPHARCCRPYAGHARHPRKRHRRFGFGKSPGARFTQRHGPARDSAGARCA